MFLFLWPKQLSRIDSAGPTTGTKATDDEFGEKTVSVLLDGEESEMIFIDHPAVEMSLENEKRVGEKTERDLKAGNERTIDGKELTNDRADREKKSKTKNNGAINFNKWISKRKEKVEQADR
ncbi:hypothetical protein RUM44_002118 [Polyplax serrata]|uniref:Uncharacterized protein n=1 Tax=Polyplax serrata TaxID=468196 RepID=A0ABR1ALY5_POLSC